MIGTTLDQDNTLSLDRILGIRSEGFAHVRHHGAMILSIATAIEALDAALMSHADCRSIDEQQALVEATRRLSALLKSEGQ